MDTIKTFTCGDCGRDTAPNETDNLITCRNCDRKKQKKCFCGHPSGDHAQQLTCTVTDCRCVQFNDAKIQRTPTISTNIQSAGYNSTTKTMIIEFKSGQTYWYNDIKPEDFREFEKTFNDADQSTGKFFRAYFLSSKNYGKLQEAI